MDSLEECSSLRNPSSVILREDSSPFKSWILLTTISQSGSSNLEFSSNVLFFCNNPRYPLVKLQLWPFPKFITILKTFSR
ncbi:hypothetical protein WICPIJ_002948 [Wickerhamomyces pijperi]|uniref:Uncharacterized protein n=1 Tax=Wickerhamomyces pijperi TaxID=599730 RepID=A0A9P8Q8L5_WICPI|nr:hypothetical protein WICPIJ_002948 [Wickerhamomyces pijperi]